MCIFTHTEHLDSGGWTDLSTHAYFVALGSGQKTLGFKLTILQDTKCEEVVDKRCTATFEKACSEVTENVCATVIDIKNEQVTHQI